MRLDADQRRIVQTVIAAFELQDLVAACGRARQTNRVHSRFRAARTEAHHLDRKALADFFRELPFHIVRHAEHRARREPLLDRLHHRGMAMPGHERAEAQVVIDVSVAIEIAKMRALAFLHEDRIGIVGAIVAGDTQGKSLQVALMGLGGFRRAALESFELLLQFGVHRESPGMLRPCHGR